MRGKTKKRKKRGRTGEGWEEGKGKERMEKRGGNNQKGEKKKKSVGGEKG